MPMETVDSRPPPCFPHRRSPRERLTLTANLRTHTMTEIVHSQTSLPPVGPVARC